MNGARGPLKKRAGGCELRRGLPHSEGAAGAAARGARSSAAGGALLVLGRAGGGQNIFNYMYYIRNFNFGKKLKFSKIQIIKHYFAKFKFWKQILFPKVSPKH